MATHGSSIMPARPSWAPRTVLVYPEKRTVSWKALLGIATLLLLMALAFSVWLFLRPIPVPHW
jgi:hypothetical protein